MREEDPDAIWIAPRDERDPAARIGAGADAARLDGQRCIPQRRVTLEAPDEVLESDPAQRVRDIRPARDQVDLETVLGDQKGSLGILNGHVAREDVAVEPD